MSFLGSLFTGSDPTLSKDINQSGAISGYGTGIGEGDTTLASNYYRNLLSGDPSMEAKALAPQISAQQGMNQSAKASASEFGNRSGGTGGYNQSIDATGRGNIISALGGLQTHAASGLTGIGSNMLNLGLNANQVQSGQAEQQLKNQQNSLIGQGLSTGLGTLEGYGLGKLPTMPGTNQAPASTNPMSMLNPYVADGNQQISQMSPTNPFAAAIPYQG